MYLDLRASSGYVKEAGKLEKNNSRINLHVILKEVATKKLRLRVLSKNGLTLRHITYAINQTDDDLLE